jgi:hypothetical protein
VYVQVLLRQGVWDSWLSCKADFELDAQQQQVAVRGSLRLKAFRFNVTDKQDLQAACGLDYVAGAGAAGSSSSQKVVSGDANCLVEQRRTGKKSLNCMKQVCCT